jgi:hypothetical protein
MAFKEFEINPSGNNLNAGDTATNDYSGSGDWDGTSVFTPNDGTTPASFIAVNDWVSIYLSGDTITRMVGQVTAVGAGVNGTVTLSTTIKWGITVASTAGAHTARLKHGGYWADLGLTGTNGIWGTGASAVVVSTKVWVKVGTYPNTSIPRNIICGGTTAFPFVIQGYKTTRGDLVGVFNGVAGTDIPALQFSNGSLQISGNDVTLKNLDLNGSTNGTILTISGTRCKLEQVRVTNTNAAVGAIALGMTGTGDEVISSWLSCPITATKTVTCGTGTNQSFHATTFVGGIVGLITSVSGMSLNRCYFTGQNGDSIQSSNTTQLTGCGFYNQVGNGMNMSSAGNGSFIASSYFSGGNIAGKAPVNNSSGANVEHVLCFGNMFYNWAAGPYLNFAESVPFVDAGTIGAEAFNNPGSGDFSIKPAYQSLSYPGAFENIATTGYLDAGPAQHQSAAGGAVYHPLKAFIVRGA